MQNYKSANCEISDTGKHIYEYNGFNRTVPIQRYDLKSCNYSTWTVLSNPLLWTPSATKLWGFPDLFSPPAEVLTIYITLPSISWLKANLTCNKSGRLYSHQTYINPGVITMKMCIKSVTKPRLVFLSRVSSGDDEWDCFSPGNDIRGGRKTE